MSDSAPRIGSDADLTDFVTATAVHHIGNRDYSANVWPEWYGGAGPSGGYVAAILLRAMTMAVGDDARPPRSLSCQFFSAAGAGEVTVSVNIRRAGRAVTFLEGSLHQDGRTHAAATAIFATPKRSLIDYDDAAMPPVAGPHALAPLDLGEPGPPLFERLDMRPAIGPPTLSAAKVSLSGGWVGLRTPSPLDAPTLCLFADCWMPAPAARLRKRPSTPTLEYTVYFRRQPEPTAQSHDLVLLQVSSQCSIDGFFDEDASVWSADGVLLAQSRQLGVLQ